MATCPNCKATYGAGVDVCPADGESLLPDEAFKGVDPDLAAGQKVGEYTIEAKIGEGGFGAVYRASHPLIGKVVAIKVLYRKFSSDPQMVSRFIDEARAVNQIRHRCIIDIFSFGQLEDGRHYYVMELLTGQALDKILAARERLPLADALPILRQLARALDAVHLKGIAHRDLKPENVFVVSDDDGPYPKLLDFGIAKLSVARPGAHKTRTGAPLGTPHYMSPEQCRGKSVDHRTDIYSFGVVTYKVLTGKIPFDGADFMEIILKHLNEAPPKPSKVHKGLPAELDAPMLAMLEKEVDRRPPSLASAVRALEEAGARAGLVPMPAPLVERESRRAATNPLGAPASRSASTVELAPTLTPEKLAPPNPSFIAAEAANLDRPRVRWWLVGLAVLAIGAAGAAGLVLFRPTKPVAAARPSPRAAVPEPAPATTPAPATASPPPPDAAPAMIVLDIQARPAGAEVILDGKPLGTAPGRFELAPRATPARLELRLDDHEPYSADITPEKDMVIAVVLERTRRAAPSRAPSPPPRSRPTPPVAPVPAVQPAPPPPPPEPPKKPDRESVEAPQWDK